MVALAVAAMPSSRPVKPSRSLVVALTATRDTSTPGYFGDAPAHDIAQRPDLGAFADQRHFQIGDPAAARGDAVDGVFEKPV